MASADAGKRAPLGMFFTGNEKDMRGNMYAYYNLSPPYTEPNKSQEIHKIMLAEHHDVKIPNYTPRPNDVHYEFTDFVIQSALWHRELDKISLSDNADLMQMVTDARGINELYNKLLSHDTTTPFKLLQQSNAATVKQLYAAKIAGLFSYSSSVDGLSSNYNTLIGSNKEIYNFVREVHGRTDTEYNTWLAIYVSTFMTELIVFLEDWRSRKGYTLPLTPDQSTELNLEYNNVFGRCIGFAMDNIYDIIIGNTVELNVTGGSATNFDNVDGMARFDTYNQPNKNNTLKLIQKYFYSTVKSYVFDAFLRGTTGSNVVNYIDRNDINEINSFVVYNSNFCQFATIVSQQLTYEVYNDSINYYKNLPHIAQRYVKLSSGQPNRYFKYIKSKWSSYSSDIQKMISTFAPILSNGKLIENYNDPGINVNEARINFRKYPAGSNQLQYSRTIPDYIKTIMNDVWYTNYSGVITKITQNVFGLNNDFFRNLYEGIFTSTSASGSRAIEVTINGALLEVPSSWSQKMPTLFTVNEQKLLARIRMDWMANRKNIMGVAATIYNSGGDYQDPRANQRFDYKDGKLVRVSETGKFTVIEHGEPGYFEDTAQNCNSTFVKENAVQTCNDFLNDCLLSESGNLNDCIKFINDSTFFSLSEEDIVNIYETMNPDSAKQILERFDFVPDTSVENGREVYRVESFEKWCSRKLVQYDTATQNAIKNNMGLHRYLSTLVNFLNSHLVLLNKDYNNKSNYTFHENSWTRDIGIQPHRRFKNSNLNIMSNLPKVNLFPVQFPGGNFVTSANLRTMLPTPFDTQNSLYMLTGQGGQVGGVSYAVDARGHRNDAGRYAKSENHGARLLERVFTNITKEMEGKGKKLGDTSAAKIKDMLDMLAKQEANVTESLTQLEKYLSLTNVFNDTRSEELSLDQIKKMTGDHSELLERYRKNQVKIFGVMNKLISITNNDPAVDAYVSTLGRGKIPENSYYNPVQPVGPPRRLSSL
jgi:hypothetical protein